MEQRYTMGQVAKDAGVGKNTLAKWEQANHVPSPKRERGGNHARSYTAEERAKVLEYAASRKQLVDVSSLPPRAASSVGEQKTA